MSKPAIVIENMSIMFNLNSEKVDNLKEYFIKLLKRQLHFTEFWALKDINLTVEKGDRVGILGFNGAGKSTLLKVIAGVLKPTEGSVRVSGVIAPMLELGAEGGVQAVMSSLTALCVLVFSLLYTPCVAAIASIRRELGPKWGAYIIVWQCFLGWVAAFLVHLIGKLIGMT